MVRVTAIAALVMAQARDTATTEVVGTGSVAPVVAGIAVAISGAGASRVMGFTSPLSRRTANSSTGTARRITDDLYYEWSATAGGYQQVQPPAGLAEKINSQASDTQLFVFPSGDQTNEQLERDRAECHSWGVQQAGFDPSAAAPHTKASNPLALKRADYLHADAACLEARDYSVE
jgi:hypothetical protein